MKKENKLSLICVFTVIALVILFIDTENGRLFYSNPYNSYMLQAQSWLEGRLDLGKDYPHLELAILNGRYFVSFPPFPSYVMLPFALLGFENADMLITIICSLLSGIYAVKIMDCFKKSGRETLIWSLLLTVGSNWLFNACVPWVWFIAQNMAFTLSMMSIYYAIKGKAGFSLTFWACAVGCRPFQIIYIFVILYLLYTHHKKCRFTVGQMLKTIILPFITAVSYMVLNYMRFGKIHEFGHNYLPEFMRVSTGQFNISYMAENVKSLFRFPLTFENGTVSFIKYNGFCIFIASPIFISYIVYLIRSLIKGNCDRKLTMLIFFSILLHFLSITLHKTMGGAHYGNRYTNDVLPFVFLSLAYTSEKNSLFLSVPLCIIGFILNLWWVILYF